ncbi:MAG: response regulator [Candidatus Omnitrophica bacterium]|nr:response regulator [Candidatus Omnitrophota bacterium]
MPEARRGIKFIAYSLVLFYATSIGIYLQALFVIPFRVHAVALLAFMVILLWACFASLKLSEWARKVLVVVNGMMAFYLWVLYVQFPELIQPSYVFLHLILFVFFATPRIRIEFQTGKNFPLKTILVIDDDSLQQKFVKKTLLPKGYSVLTALTGEQGLEMAKAQKPDLILLDVILPAMKGREVCAILKQDFDTKDIPIVFMTVKDSSDDMTAEKAVGGISHLTKPVNPRELLSVVKKNLKE